MRVGWSGAEYSEDEDLSLCQILVLARAGQEQLPPEALLVSHSSRRSGRVNQIVRLTSSSRVRADALVHSATAYDGSVRFTETSIR